VGEKLRRVKDGGANQPVTNSKKETETADNRAHRGTLNGNIAWPHSGHPIAGVICINE
jgi:hypothetical protein